MQNTFSFCYPNYDLKFTLGSTGVLVSSSDVSSSLAVNELRVWFDHFLEQTTVFGPPLPPTRQELLNQQLRHITAQTMIVLAILGWILPILPGTPFFLVAWALGWRPPGSKHVVPVE